MKPVNVILATATLVTALQQAGIWGLVIPSKEEAATELKRQEVQVCSDNKYDEKIRTEFMAELYSVCQVALTTCRGEVP